MRLCAGEVDVRKEHIETILLSFFSGAVRQNVLTGRRVLADGAIRVRHNQLIELYPGTINTIIEFSRGFLSFRSCFEYSSDRLAVRAFN